MRFLRAPHSGAALRLAMTALGAAALCAGGAAAQSLEIAFPPTSVLPNYDRLQLGENEALEAGAFVARTDNAAAAWYNPAGLALSERSGLSAGAVAYEWTTVRVEGLGESNSHTRFNSFSTLVAGVIGAPILSSDRWRLGVSLARPVAWRPGGTEGVAEQSSAAGSQRLSYASEVEFTTSIPAVAAAYRAGNSLRFGASVGAAYTVTDQRASLTGRFVTAESMLTRSRQFSVEGRTTSFLFSVGAQWDFARGWTAGAVITSPGVRIGGSSLLLYEASELGTARSGDLYFRDEEARFEYRIPLRVAAGISRRYGRGAIEADVRYHHGTDDYAVFTSSATGRATVTQAGGSPTSRAVAFVETPEQARSVWNVAVGGHYDLTASWTAHLGFFSDQSPVDDPDQSIFRQADLYGVTAGATLHGDHLSGALGITYAFGTAEDRFLGELVTGEDIGTRLEIRNIGLNYAIAYAF